MHYHYLRAKEALALLEPYAHEKVTFQLGDLVWHVKYDHLISGVVIHVTDHGYSVLWGEYTDKFHHSLAEQVDGYPMSQAYRYTYPAASAMVQAVKQQKAIKDLAEEHLKRMNRNTSCP